MIKKKKQEKRLRIAQIAPLWFKIPPEKYGGIERIIYLLTEGLTKLGHQVTLFATEDSKTKATLKAITKKDLISQKIPWHDWWWNNLNHSFAFEMAEKFDILHCHWNILGAFFQRFVKTKVLHTLHNIPKINDHRWRIFDYYKKDLNVVFISKKEAKNSPINFRRKWIIYNGIDLSQFEFNEKPKNHFIWIGRICEAKGTEKAILAAKKAKVKLLIAGQIQAHYQEYFKKKIKPNLGEKIKYIGELSQKQLSDFYKNALALLYPIEWQEPFGLVMVEAMACGTPVIAFNKGSVPEVVKDKKTGFVVKNIEEMVKAMKKINKISRRACRERVKKYFSFERMILDYEKVYYKLLER
jgi:glycosyltransferase involved in cell wall biosynthesis